MLRKELMTRGGIAYNNCVVAICTIGHKASTAVPSEYEYVVANYSAKVYGTWYSGNNTVRNIFDNVTIVSNEYGAIDATVDLEDQLPNGQHGNLHIVEKNLDIPLYYIFNKGGIASGDFRYGYYGFSTRSPSMGGYTYVFTKEDNEKTYTLIFTTW